MNWDEIWQGSIMTSRKFGALGNGGWQGLGDKESRRHPQSNHPFPEPRSQTSTKPHAFVRIIVEQTLYRTDIMMMMIKIRYLVTSESLSPTQLVCMPGMEQAVS